MNDKDKFIKKFKKIPSIKSQKIKTPPAQYDYYIYKVTDLDMVDTPDVKSYYVGTHIKNEDIIFDPYIASSTDEDFDKLISNPNSNVLMEVFGYGTKEEMIDLEATIHEEADVANNSKWFNKKPAIRPWAQYNRTRVNKLFTMVQDGYFTTKKESTDFVFNMPRYQIRYADNPEQIVELTDSIDLKAGDTTLSKPIIVLEEVGRQGDEDGTDDVRVSGHHTISSHYRAKHVKESEVTRIPRKYTKDFTEADIIAFGRRFNKRPEEIIVPDTDDDAVKFLLGEASRGVPIRSINNQEHLIEDMGWTPRKTKAIFKKAEIEFRIQTRQKKKNELYMDYDNNPKAKKLLKKRIKDLTSNDTIVVDVSSAMIHTAWGKFIQLKMKNDKVDKLIWLIKFAKDSSRWINKLQSQLTEETNYFLHEDRLDMGWDFEYMDKFVTNDTLEGLK